MSFSEGLATGYSVTRDLRKRHAVNKYLKEVERLTADPNDEKDPGDEGPPGPVASATAPVGGEETRADRVMGVEKGIDTPEAGEVNQDAAIAGASTAGVATAPAVAIPAGAEYTAPTAASEPADGYVPTDAPPSAPNLDLLPGAAGHPKPAIEVDPPKSAMSALPVGGEAQTKAKTRVPRESITPENIKYLDKLALKSAQATGDMEVYNALRASTDSLLQGKLLKNLGMAANAWDNNDMPEAKFRFQNAYSFFPDGQKINVKERDGKLWVKNPGGKGEEIELTSGIMMSLGQRAIDPVGWRKAIREDKASEATIAAKERTAAAAEESNVIAAEKNELTRSRDAYKNLADYMGALGKDKEKGKKPAESFRIATGASAQFEDLVTMKTHSDPTDMTSPVVKAGNPAFTEFANSDGTLTEAGITAKAQAGVIAVENPDMGPVDAAQISMAMVHSLGNPKSDMVVDDEHKTITVTVAGAERTFDAPQKLINMLIALGEKEQAAKENRRKVDTSVNHPTPVTTVLNPMP